VDSNIGLREDDLTIASLSTYLKSYVIKQVDPQADIKTDDGPARAEWVSGLLGCARFWRKWILVTCD
jgi:hypothetical protein